MTNEEQQKLAYNIYKSGILRKDKAVYTKRDVDTIMVTPFFDKTVNGGVTIMEVDAKVIVRMVAKYHGVKCSHYVMTDN